MNNSSLLLTISLTIFCFINGNCQCTGIPNVFGSPHLVYYPHDSIVNYEIEFGLRASHEFNENISFSIGLNYSREHFKNEMGLCVTSYPEDGDNSNFDEVEEFLYFHMRNGESFGFDVVQQSFTVPLSAALTLYRNKLFALKLRSGIGIEIPVIRKVSYHSDAGIQSVNSIIPKSGYFNPNFKLQNGFEFEIFISDKYSSFLMLSTSTFKAQSIFQHYPGISVGIERRFAFKKQEVSEEGL